MKSAGKSTISYLHESAIEEVSEKYKELGYKVTRDVRLGSCVADLVAIKGKEKIYFEFKVGELNKIKKQQLVRLHKFVQEHEPAAQFRLINVNPPRKVLVEIEGIERILFEQLQNDVPNELETLSTHTSIDEVSAVEIDSIVIKENNIWCKGSFIVNLFLQYGSDVDVEKDNGFHHSESFPADFELELDGELNVERFDRAVDTSSWRE